MTYEEPVLPYGGGSGWSGTDTSRDRAEDEDASGKTAERQHTVRVLLREAGERGLTYTELGEATGWHHGQSSSALSTLHKAGVIARLLEKRGRCRIYVHPEYVMGRPTDEQGRSHVCCRETLEILDSRITTMRDKYVAENGGRPVDLMSITLLRKMIESLAQERGGTHE